MRLGKAVDKYLRRYAEPVVLRAPKIPGEFAHAVVIPAYGEGDCLERLVAGIPTGAHGPVAVIVVVNARADSPAWVHESNAQTVARLGRSYPRRAQQDGVSLHDHPQGALVLIEAELPAGEGVGLARKIGSDFAFALWAAGRLHARHIHTTDADAALPHDYFRAACDRTGAALLYPFRHLPPDDPALTEAVLRYELGLRYYVQALGWARSPYAFHSVGSTLAIDALAYAQVRGFPLRAAGEDFYMLNKLAKVGAVISLSGPPILLLARPSERAPFGTGRALRLARDQGRLPEAYHPEIFVGLRELLSVLAKPPQEAARVARSLEARLAGAASRIGLWPALERAQRDCKSDGTYARRVHGWFDGFRTLKLVHALRDLGLPSLPVEEALARAPFAAARDLPRDLTALADTLYAWDQDAARQALTPA